MFYFNVSRGPLSKTVGCYAMRYTSLAILLGMILYPEHLFSPLDLLVAGCKFFICSGIFISSLYSGFTSVVSVNIPVGKEENTAWVLLGVPKVAQVVWRRCAFDTYNAAF